MPTIHSETSGTPVGADEILYWSVGGGYQRRSTIASMIGATLTGSGTIATGGFTLTLTANSSLNGHISGGGTLALGGYTLTAPATGTVVTADGTQTLTNKTINNIKMTYVSLTNTQIAPLTTWTPLTQSFLVVNDFSNGYFATFQVRGGANVTNEISDPSTKFSHTAGTGSSINVYYLGGTGYVIQNNSGGTIFVGVHAIGS